jgi:hypothetical protein
MKYIRLLTIQMFNTKKFKTIDAGYFPTIEGVRYELFVENEGPGRGQKT